MTSSKRNTRHKYVRSKFRRTGTSVELIDVQTHRDGEIEGWIDASPVAVQGSYEHTTAVIIKLNSGDGIVKIFVGDRVVRSYHTNSNFQSEVIMVFLPPTYYC